LIGVTTHSWVIPQIYLLSFQNKKNKIKIDILTKTSWKDFICRKNQATILNGIESQFDANLVITWSRNPHAKTPIPGKPSKSGLIGV
jgi:hypothetical protein